MGCIWRITMPLLSTLAALVIIVHSAEEGRDREYNYELRPSHRSLDTGTPSYDQPWRVVEPMMQESTPADSWRDSHETPMKRRRPVRKRKRRPLPTSDEDLPPNVRYVDNPDPDYQQTSDMPKRRRKNPEGRRNRWAEDYLATDRPLRRRSQRRKRPSLETWPELSEFNLYKTDENADDKAEEILDANENTNYNNDTENKNFDDVDEDDVGKTLTESPASFINNDEVKLKEEKSLSEFSAEAVTSDFNVKEDDKMVKLRDKLGEKSPAMAEQDKGKNGGPIDPLMLKEILKRSNGASLSEILQQHNLSLADLLHGREDAISVLKSKDSHDNQETNITPGEDEDSSEAKHVVANEDEEQQHQENKENKTVLSIESATDNVVIEFPLGNERNETNKEDIKIQENSDEKKITPKIPLKRRFPGSIRRKLRMRPMLNNTYKGQFNRDLMSLTTRKYLNNRNTTRLNDISMMKNVSETNKESSKNEVTEPLPTTTIMPEETTVNQNTEYRNPSTVTTEPQTTDNIKRAEDDETSSEINKASTDKTTEAITTEIVVTTTEKPKMSRNVRPTVNRMGLRRQAFNNRLKKKRLKEKISTTQSPQDELMTDLFGMPNLVSSSEFIARTPKPTSTEDGGEDFTSLDDFITTERSRKIEKEAAIKPIIISTTEENAKFEIEEILNDTITSARLSKILMERNMTLSELVEHRERGSSHVHLADIFHNASKEPNPPEPFLSKSSIEPISKETYPLRALLEGKMHDPKATTIEPNLIESQFVNIPVVMDFGNNVNENGENMGIMALFNKITGSDTEVEQSTLKKDSQGTPYVSTVISLNTTNTNETVRESRTFKDDEANLTHSMSSWNELLSMMQKNHHKNATEQILEAIEKEFPVAELVKKNTLETDTDGDGVIVLEDLQHLKDIDSNIASASDEKFQVSTFEGTEPPVIKPGILVPPPSDTRSVTVAIACIVGLSLVLFLLTYAAFKWNQQRRTLRKKHSFSDERIPTPVFESRIGHKNNCSTRSISPMLASSNIYTLNTLDSRNGKESPDYMWDSLRKPFQ